MNYQGKIYRRKTQPQAKLNTQSPWSRRTSQYALEPTASDKAKQKIAGTPSVSFQESQFFCNFSQVPVQEITGLQTHTIQKMDDSNALGEETISSDMLENLSQEDQFQYSLLLSQDCDPITAYDMVLSNQNETSTITATSTIAPKIYKSLPSPPGGLVKQEEAGWCYAATAMTLARYKGIEEASDPIWKVVAATKEDNEAEQEIRKKYGADFGQEEKVLKTLSVPYTHLLNLNLGTILSQLEQGNAVILAWGGHSRVVIGADMTRGGEYNVLKAWDPKDKEIQEIQVGLLDDSACEIYY
ncbi:MAG: hypothetical protein HC851_12690 [Acaryochloris sp. RU_4_1]|nr:hypothetical protein [Acaryochloris sp. RU_4_1]NJR55103.1 hypothetical protein [Acaryochloris sp. CRU_2_0]